MSNQAAVGGIVDPSKYSGRVLGAVIAGYAFDAVDLMVIALSLPLIIKDWGISMVQGGFIASAMLVGGVLGGYVFGPIADKFGRKKALVWCIGFFAIATGLGGFAQDYLQLAALRFLAGLGLGAEWALGATMLAEFTPAEKRGKANSFMQMGWPIGFIFALICQYTLVPIYGWRALYFVGTLGILVAGYIQFFLPESPVWMKAQIAKKEGKANGEVIKTATAADLLEANIIKTFIVVIIICTSALIAYWGVNTWLPTVLTKEKGMDPKDISKFLLYLNLISFPAYIISAFINDKIGKRKFTGITAVLSAITLFFWLFFEWNPAMFLIWGLLSWATASGMWSSFGAYIAEQFPTNVRAIGVATSFSTGRAVVVFVPMAMGAAAQASASLALVMAIIAAFYLVAGVAAFVLKETRAHM